MKKFKILNLEIWHFSWLPSLEVALFCAQTSPPLCCGLIIVRGVANLANSSVRLNFWEHTQKNNLNKLFDCGRI